MRRVSFENLVNSAINWDLSIVLKGFKRIDAQLELIEVPLKDLTYNSLKLTYTAHPLPREDIFFRIGKGQRAQS